MFGISLDLSLKDFKRLIENPKPAIIGLTSQLVLLPILTFLLTQIWPMPPSIAMGLIMVASCPGGNISNFSVHLARGNTALSISLTSAVTLLAVIITPVTFQFWTSFIPDAQPLLKGIDVVPIDMFKAIAQLILVPLIVGMSIKNYFPRLAEMIRKPIANISLLLFAGFIIAALVGNGKELRDYLGIVFWLVLVHNGLALLIGYQFARINKLGVPERKAISMETGIQNAGLGLVLIFNFFDGLGGMMLVAAWWGIWDLISGFGLSLFWRWRSGLKRSIQ
jgi:BASS family bile acid:Na+ symporter